MRVRKDFFRGGKSTFCLFFSGCWCCNANGRSQNDLPFLHHTGNSHVTTAVAKMLFIGSNAFIHSYFFSHRIKIRGLLISAVTVSGLPATDDCFQQSHAEKRLLPPVTSCKPLEICCSFCYSCCCFVAFATRFQIKQIN